MAQEHTIAFGPFRLETPPGRLWQGDYLIPLRPRCPGPRLLAHRDDDGIPPEAEHQPRPLRLQVHDHTRLVLQPEIACTRRAAGLTRLGPWYHTRSWHLRLGG